MRPGVPWSVKDISPEAREAAQVAASRAGLTLGEWLSQAIAQEARTLAAHEAQAAQRAPYRPQSPVPNAYSPPQPAFQMPPEPRAFQAVAAENLHTSARNSEFTIVAHGLRDLADRLESNERRQQQAITTINQNVAAMADKVDAADRIKTMAESAFASAADAINKSTRDQSVAFESLESTVTTISERLNAVEAQSRDGATARDTLSKLESTLDGFKARLTEAERRGFEAQASLENWAKSLAGRVDATARETADAIRGASSSFEKSIDQVRTDLAEQERRQREKTEALQAIQSGLNGIRAEISETDRRAREAVSGLAISVQDLRTQVDCSKPNAEIQAFAESMTALRSELKIVADGAANEMAVRDRANKDAQLALDASLQRLSTQVAQSEARTEQSIALLRDGLGRYETQLVHASSDTSSDTDFSIQSLQRGLEELTANFSKSEQANAQNGQRQAAAIRKVEDMLQGFARGLDSIGDVTKGPLSQPMAVVQSTLETITAKLEDSDRRAAASIGAIETALKALESRIDDSEKRQAQFTTQLQGSITQLGTRIESSEHREQDLQQKLDDSFRDVLDRIEDSERKSADAIEAVETGMTTINQRLDTADRRQKEGIAGLRLTVDGLVAKAASEPLLQRTSLNLPSAAPQALAQSAAALPMVLSAPATSVSPPRAEVPPRLDQFPPAEMTAQSPSLPSATARVLELPPVLPPLEAHSPYAGFDVPPAQSALPSPLSQMEGPPAPSFEDLLAQAVPAQQSSTALPPLEPLAPAKKSDDFLAQARRAAQAAAMADAAQQASAQGQKPDRKAARSQSYAQEGDRNWGRFAIIAVVVLAVAAAAIAAIMLAPWRASGDDVNRPAAGSSLGEMMSPDAAPAPRGTPSAPASFTELPPAPDATLAPAFTNQQPSAAAEPVQEAPAETPAALPAPQAAGAPQTVGVPAAAGIDPNLEERAQHGDAKAQYVLAMRYADPRSTQRAPAKSFQLLQSAAQSGLPAAQYRLGALYERGGDGVARDPEQARTWYEKAGLNGNRKAMHNLAVLYAEGVGTPANMTEAAKWFQRGAEYGLTDSQYNLGVLYERGLGVPRNLAESIKWYAIAAAQGDTGAAGKLNALKQELGEPGATKALAAARSFVPKTPAPAANDSPQSGG